MSVHTHCLKPAALKQLKAPGWYRLRQRAAAPFSVAFNTVFSQLSPPSPKKNRLLVFRNLNYSPCIYHTPQTHSVMMINSAIQIKHIIKSPSSALVPLKRKLQSSIHSLSLFSAEKFWHRWINSIFLQITSTELEFQVHNYGIIQLLHWRLILSVSELFLLLLFHLF